ncbi:MAG: phage integrase N-terminal SAM-like domain-containing protein [Chromatiales bacterium]
MKGIIEGAASPTVGKHGMDRHQNPAPARGLPRLLDQVRDIIWRLHYSIRTEQAYVDWIRRFILFYGKRHPADMGAPASGCIDDDDLHARAESRWPRSAEPAGCFALALRSTVPAIIVRPSAPRFDPQNALA